MRKPLGIICRLSIELTDEDDRVVARTRELDLVDHGKTKDEARKQLMKTVALFFDVCAERGSLLDVLQERNVLHTSLPAGAEQETIEVPVPLLAFEQRGQSVGHA